MYDVTKCWRSSLTGMAGNLRVASELLLRGLNVSLPVVDAGVDLEVEGLVRIQVKSSHVIKYQPERIEPAYNFSLMRGPKALGGERATKSLPRSFVDTCDFLVLWGIEQNRFWIVPAAMVEGRKSLYLGTEGRFIPTDATKIQEMLDAGKDQRTIARELGISEMTVSRRIRKILAEPCQIIADLMRIRACEGRWDYIQSYIDTMREAHRASSVAFDAVTSSPR